MSPGRRSREVSGYPRSCWAEYFRIHAALIAVSGTADVPTMSRIFRACADVGLLVTEIEEITAAAFGYDGDRIAMALRSLRASELRFALLADCYQIARAARVDAPEHEPDLRHLAAYLQINHEQRLAISWYIWACDPLVEHPWRDFLSEVNMALHRVGEAGASRHAVTETRGLTLRGGAEYTGLIRLCREVLPNDHSEAGEAS